MSSPTSRPWTGLKSAFWLTVAALTTGAAVAADAPAKRDPLKELDALTASSRPNATVNGTASPALARDIRVQITAPNMATIGAPMSGRLTSFPLKDGERFKEGQVLARFHCAVQEATQGRFRAILEKKRRILDTQDKLRKLGTNSAIEYDVAAAEVQEAQADVNASAAVLSNCQVTAPFAGRVTGISTHEHQFVTEGAPLLEIISDRQLELEMIVPSRWLSVVKPGTRFDIAVDETHRTYKAEVTRLSGKVDAVSQSVKVYGRIADGGDDLLAGMSGKAMITGPEDQP